MKKVVKMLLMTSATVAFADLSAKNATAHRRYPWSGLVDIVVAMEGSADGVADAVCSFKVRAPCLRSRRGK